MDKKESARKYWSDNHYKNPLRSETLPSALPSEKVKRMETLRWTTKKHSELKDSICFENKKKRVKRCPVYAWDISEQPSVLPRLSETSCLTARPDLCYVWSSDNPWGGADMREASPVAYKMKEISSVCWTCLYPRRQNVGMALDLRVSEELESPGGQTTRFYLCHIFGSRFEENIIRARWAPSARPILRCTLCGWKEVQGKEETVKSEHFWVVCLLGSLKRTRLRVRLQLRSAAGSDWFALVVWLHIFAAYGRISVWLISFAASVVFFL